VPPVDIATLLTNNTGPIIGGLIGSASTLLTVLITQYTMRSSSRKERTDEYHREVRSAASSIVHTAHIFIDSANAFEKSMFWEDTVRITRDHDESYRACQTANAELQDKIEDFNLLVDINALSKAAFRLRVNTLTAYNAIATINMLPEWPRYTEDRLKAGLEKIYQHMITLEAKALPNFQECVYKYMHHTIVDDKRQRRRTRILRPFTASWRWLIKQHRKNLPRTPPKQTPPTRTGPPPACQSTAPTTEDHATT
jgi:hypothetical protein